MKIYHWWPGRTWAGPCPIPEDIIAEALRKGTRYLTMAKANIIGWAEGCYMYGLAECCPRDVPDRKRGREIAIGRLEKLRDTWLPWMEL